MPAAPRESTPTPTTPPGASPLPGTTPALDFVLFSLDDAELDLAIAEQESMVKRNPSMATYMEASLAAHRQERERRSEPPNNKFMTPLRPIVDHCTNSHRGSRLASPSPKSSSPSPPVPESREPPSPPCSPEKPALKLKRFKRPGAASAAPGATVPRERANRVRFEPERYGGKNNPEAAKRKRKYDCPALQAQYEANQIMREQLRTNQATIEKTAEDLRCPLTALKLRKVDVTPNGTRHDRPVECPFLGAQMKMVAVADDGHFYDFTHITRYIRDNVHGLLRSPVTNEPMAGQVYYMKKCKTTRKPKMHVWTAEIFVTEELRETDSGDEDDDSGARGASGFQEALAVD